MPRVEQITYFEDTGKAQQNTRGVVRLVGDYLKSHRVPHVVMATNTGYVGAQFAPLAKAHPKVSFVGVKMAPAIDAMYDVKWNRRYGRAMDEAGVKLVSGTHALTGGVDRALQAKFEGSPPGAIIAQTLYLFSQGMKVAVEIIAMACDAGATSAASANLFDMDIHRILAMPLRS